jgi:hypothetical protein
VYVLNLRANILDLKAQFYEKMGLTAQSLDYRKKYELANDSLVAQNNIAAVEVVKMQYVISKQQAEENRLITQANIKAHAAQYRLYGVLPVVNNINSAV